jgi:hypothetical protein
MKRITAIAIFALASILSAGKVSAQAHAVRAAVPFDFTVSGKLLPPGTYTITPLSDHVIEIQNRDQHISILSSAFPNGRQSENSNKLVFQRYGDQYFLREILCESDALNMDLPVTKSEKRARMEEAKVQSASQVLVATK